MKSFIWRPGDGIDEKALARMTSKLGRPQRPMGEAWFMGGDRKLFFELQGDLSKLTARDFQEPLRSIASGTSSFGPYAEWIDWYHFLLPQLVLRSHESFVSSLLESLITAFMALYPNGVHAAPYQQFHEDALATLGRCMMEPDCWSGDNIVAGTILHRSNKNPARTWCWDDASGDFSASMFFCLKYLLPSQVPEWFSSALAIESPHWRAQILVWLIGAKGILSGRIHWPSEWDIGERPGMGWEWSHCLRQSLASADESGAPVSPSLISADSRLQLLSVAKQYFTEDVYLEWLESIDRVAELKSELAELPSTFECLYVNSESGWWTR